MKKFIKTLSLAVLLVLVVALTACGTKTTEVVTTKAPTQLEEATSALILSIDKAYIKGDFTLPSVGKNNATITWVSSNTTAINIAAQPGTDGFYKATVTRPENGSGNVVLNLTATVTLNGESKTREFEVRVIEKAPVAGGTVSSVLAVAKGTEVVLNNVIVYAIISDGYYVYDETGFIFVYSTPTDEVKVGDKVNIAGAFTIYYDQPELEKVTSYTVVSSGNALPTPEVTTIAAITAFDTKNKEVYAKFYQVEGLVTIQGSDAYIVDEDGKKLQINYKSDAAAVKAFDGKKVTINLVLHTYRGDAGAWRMSFVNGTGDITELTMSDQQKLDAVKSSLTIDTNVIFNLTLQTEVNGVTISWASDNTAVIAADGKVVRPAEGAGDATVTLTATLTIGTLTETKTFSLTVKEEKIYTIAEALAAEAGTVITIEAVYTGWDYKDNFFVQDSTGGIYIFGNSVLGGATNHANVGKTIKITGTKDFFKGLHQIKITNALGYTVTNETSTRPEPIVVTDFTNMAQYEGKLIKLVNVNIGAKASNKTEISDQAGNVIVTLFYGPAVQNQNNVDVVAVYYNQADNGRTNAVVISNAADVVATTAIVTDAQKLANAKSDLTVVSETMNDLTLPTVDGDVTITWSSNNEAVLSNAGVVVRPAAGSADVTVTLTATLTIGTLTETVTFDVIVKAEEVTVPNTGITNLFFSEYIEGGSNNKVLEIFNGTGSTIDLTGYTVELYSNGASTTTNTLTLTGTLAHGEVYIIVNGGSNADILALKDVDSTVTYFNGDDAILLKHNGTIIDSIGQLGTDPGSAWISADTTVSTVNMTLVRKASIKTGDIIVDDAFDPSVEWIAYPIDTISNLGSHTVE